MATSASEKNGIIARLREQGDLVTACALMAFMVIMVVPMPPLAMDMFLALSITVSILVLLVTFFADAAAAIRHTSVKIFPKDCYM